MLVAAIGLALPRGAAAGGYDTPLLYSARHMGMGGVAISFVNDPSAIFHNPAGLARAHRLSVLGDFSPVIGSINGSPAVGAGGAPINLRSETTFAPFFLLGLSYQPLPWLAIGLAAYPVASAGGEYVYQNAGGTTVVDYTKLFFLEIAPAIAFHLPGRVTLGASYRITMVSLERSQTPEGSDPTLSMDLSGFNFAGFRVGAQWEAIAPEMRLPVDHLSIGLTYRHVTRTAVEADQITALGMPLYEATSEFTLPSQLGAGLRLDVVGLGIAFDFIYGFNSQNTDTTISANMVQGDDSTRLSLANIFEWENAVTLRTGLEYTIRLTGQGDRHLLRPRIGYVYDGKTTNEEYVTAFGTPPAPTHVITAGLGYDGGPWEINLAYAYRFGEVDVTFDPEQRERPCQFCSYPGHYEVDLHGVYLDLSLDLWPRGYNPIDRRRAERDAEPEPEPVAEPTAPEPAPEPVPEAAPADAPVEPAPPAEGASPEDVTETAPTEG